MGNPGLKAFLKGLWKGQAAEKGGSERLQFPGESRAWAGWRLRCGSYPKDSHSSSEQFSQVLCCGVDSSFIRRIAKKC